MEMPRRAGSVLSVMTETTEPVIASHLIDSCSIQIATQCCLDRRQGRLQDELDSKESIMRTSVTSVDTLAGESRFWVEPNLS